jgi:sugar/nucleoside kinase (ribokinase family)
MDITAQLIQLLRKQSYPEPVVTVIGDLGYDYIFTCPELQRGKEVVIREVTRTLAGAAGYLSCGLARLGAGVYLLTKLGDDVDGRQLYKEIVHCGVEAAGIRLVENTKSYFTLIFTSEGESKPRQVATYLGPLADMSAEELNYNEFFAKSDLVYSCNYFQLPALRKQIGQIFSHAHGMKIPTAYDANAGDGWEDPDNLELLKNSIYPNTDMVFLNDHEAYCLTGERDPEKAISTISSDVDLVVIKLGSRGVVVRHQKHIYHCAAFTASGIVRDTVGAGDSFQAAFLYFYLRNFPVPYCAVLGCANAAATLEYQGATRGQQSCSGLEAILRAYNIRIPLEGRIEITPK